MRGGRGRATAARSGVLVTIASAVALGVLAPADASVTGAAGPHRAAGTGAPTESARAPVSLWAWSVPAPQTLVDLAVEQDVDRIYSYVYRTRGAELRRLQRLSELAEDAGIELWALSGDPHWALQHRAALGWQRRALATGLFAGTHLDVEPYSLPAWDKHRDRVVRKFLGLLEAMEQADARPLVVDVPFWYGTIDTAGGTLADDVLGVVDGVTVMSYRDTATGLNSLSEVALDMVQRADSAGVALELAVETNRLDDCTHCTFYEEGAGAMREVIGEVDAIMADHPSYRGFAIHDLGGLAALLDRQPAGR